MRTQRNINFFGTLCVGLILGTLCASELVAQDYRAKMQGVVTDSSKAALPGATVTLSNDNTGVETIRTANESGHYIFDFVDPGTYTVSIEMPGFSKFVPEERSGAGPRRRDGGRRADCRRRERND